MKKNKLLWQQHAERELAQYHAVKLILTGRQFKQKCILLKIENDHQLTDDQLRFAAKGFLRLALEKDQDGAKWRRLLGTHKRHWVSAEIKNTKSPSRANNEQELLEHWKAIDSPVLNGKSLLRWGSVLQTRYFNSSDALREGLSACPICRWSEKPSCPMLTAAPTGDGVNKKWLLVQVDDVQADGYNFSTIIEDAFKSNQTGLDFTFVASHCCALSALPQSKSTAPAAFIAPDFPLRIHWRIIQKAPLISGMDEQSARIGLNETENTNVRNLRLRTSANAFTPAIMLSSVKGMFRTATAWLYESICRHRLSTEGPVTSDYHPHTWPDRRACPVRAVCGGPLPQLGEKIPHSQSYLRLHSAKPNRLTGDFIALQSNGAWKTNPMRFANAIQDSTIPRKALLFESVSLENEHQNMLITEILPGRHQKAALLSTCLAADLISAGFFRLGRLKSRGFGVIQLQPVGVHNGLLSAITQEKPIAPHQTPQAQSGWQLAQAFGFTDGVEDLKNWLSQFRLP